eukprot:GHVP01054465.1.p1 GENE.GHVP01054465.1~~GHVP01054465.1.p1  ORF type:complete len:206 (-),score=15.13 GHVP01054465.1:412-1029(-)
MQRTEIPQQFKPELYEIERDYGIFTTGDATFSTEGSMSTIETLIGFRMPSLFAMNHNIISQRNVLAIFIASIRTVMPNKSAETDELSIGAQQVLKSFLSEFTDIVDIAPNAPFYDAKTKILYKPDAQDLETLKILAVFCTKLMGMRVQIRNPLAQEITCTFPHIRESDYSHRHSSLEDNRLTHQPGEIRHQPHFNKDCPWLRMET